MKKFKFTLDRIKQYRIQIEEMEKNDLSALRAELSELEEQAEEIKDAIIAKSEELRRLYRKGAFPNEISVANRYLTYKKQLLEIKLGEIEEKNIQIEKKLQDVIEATQEVKKMEKLEEHQLEEYKQAELKESENFIEEFFGAKPNAEA
ncbi:MAG TPA: flagellar export protein FliJ [Ruminococcaceae bacterium]|nr:flagellar export protein FliJ [Oscillospiraceae bacterium]